MNKLVIGKEVKVLNHGFVRVVDVMGDDSAIVQAARVSYGDGTKTKNEDEGLIDYLVANQHSSPLEMCLAGDVRIPTFARYGTTIKTYTVRQIVEAFENGGKNSSWVKLLKIRTVNPKTGVVAATKIKNAFRTGVNMVYEIMTETPFNRCIRVTSNHPIMTPEGFKSIDDGLSVGDEIMHNGCSALADDVVKEIKRRRAEGDSIRSVSNALNISKSVVYKYSPGRAKKKTGFLMKPYFEVQNACIFQRSE